MNVEIRVPLLPESVADATLVAWRKQPGESVSRDENLADLETDKVVLEVPSPVAGVLQEIRAPAGSTVKNGELLAVVAAGAAASVRRNGRSPAATPPAARRPRLRRPRCAGAEARSGGAARGRRTGAAARDDRRGGKEWASREVGPGRCGCGGGRGAAGPATTTAAPAAGRGTAPGSCTAGRAANDACRCRGCGCGLPSGWCRRSRRRPC